MRIRFLLVFISLIAIIFITVGCNNNKNDKPTIIINDITTVTDQLRNDSTVTEQLRNNSLIRYMGSSINPEKKYSKVLFIIDREKITGKQFKEMVQSYISNIEKYASRNNWKEEFKAYSFRFEEMVDGSKDPVILAEKLPESTEIAWNTDW